MLDICFIFSCSCCKLRDELGNGVMGKYSDIISLMLKGTLTKLGTQMRMLKRVAVPLEDDILKLGQQQSVTRGWEC